MTFGSASLACAMVDAAPESVLMCRCASSPPAVPDSKANERVSAPGSLSSLPERSNSIRFGQSTGRSWSSGPPCRYPKALCERSKALRLLQCTASAVRPWTAASHSSVVPSAE